MIVWLVRHGETVTSGRTFAGRSDVALSAAGQARARELAHDPALRPVGAIVTSPLARARETARPLAETVGVEPILDPHLVEFDFGVYEGRSKRALGLKLRDAHRFAPVPQGESLWEVWQRAGKVIGALEELDAAPGTSVVVVGHFWINRLIFERARGLDFEQACRSRGYLPVTGSVVRLDL
jgi:probable phosphoglycerate mutase